jgi:hypothetical protein
MGIHPFLSGNTTMSNNVRTVSGSLSNDQRALLLRQFYPKFDQVYCVQVTWAYNVPEDFDFPRQLLNLTISGHHVGDGHEALVARLTDPGDQSRFPAGPLGLIRPDGKPLHLTLSTASGIPPARAGDIDLGKVLAVKPVSLRIRFHNRFASRITPTPLFRLAA